MLVNYIACLTFVCTTAKYHVSCFISSNSVGTRPANPTTGTTTIQTSTNDPSVATFILRNALGQELMRFTKALPSGQVSTQLDMHSFPAGAYFLEVQSGTERVVERLLKH
jgi:hypothetical protein